ncbi:MAG: 4Fe-4S dicluster domain-containing protein [Aphanocapsa lilacina HA4352-LM1]|jgi:glycolate oxidase iron-sulfur subunit|nr:4Fe-4S dicluster domain-containing protein [Aphanocapsa lilacina HA4352-LM1]
MENQPRLAVPRAFDANHPPDAQMIDTCVHCGFCLATCPSYRVLGTEMDSPRGRIYLMDALNEGEISLSQATAGHFDSCLGCLACVSTCPSGVQYDQLIAATRPQVERNVERSVPDRLLRALIFNLLPYPRRLRPLLLALIPYQKLGVQKLVRKSGLLQKFAPRLAAMESILPAVPASAFAAPMPERVAAQGKQRFRVGMITGCVQRLFFDRVNRATLRVLTAIGCEVVIPRSQGCCAALPQHQGQSAQARQMARDLIDSFADSNVDYLIINAAGCGHTLKEYGHILADDPVYRERAAAFAAKVRDVQEFLYWAKILVPLQPIADGPLAVVYQDACHLLHGQRISLQPRQLLAQIPGVQVREPVDAALCCGSAGVYNILQPEIGEELGRQKVENLLATGAVLIASANPGCTLQIRKHLELTGQAVPVRHPMELIDAAIRGVKVADLPAS